MAAATLQEVTSSTPSALRRLSGVSSFSRRMNAVTPKSRNTWATVMSTALMEKMPMSCGLSRRASTMVSTKLATRARLLTMNCRATFWRTEDTWTVSKDQMGHLSDAQAANATGLVLAHTSFPEPIGFVARKIAHSTCLLVKVALVLKTTLVGAASRDSCKADSVKVDPVI